MGRYYGYHRRHRTRRRSAYRYKKQEMGSRSKTIIIVLATLFAMSLFGSLIVAILKLLANLAVLVLGICVIGAVLYALFAIVKKRVDKYILNNSEALRTIREINSRYNFDDVDNMDMKHSYDNKNMFQSISPEAYLTYQLIYKQKQALDNIKRASSNKKKYTAYKKEIDAVNYGCINENKPFFIRWYMKWKERDICLDEIETPIVDFCINVRLNLTNIRGRFQYASERSFDTEEIKKIISNLSDQSNGFYKNQNVWDAISHVERAKVSNKMRFSVYKRDGNKCRKCGSTRGLEVDHIIPIAKGGKTTFDNLQTLCHKCNMEKGSKIEYSAVKHLVNKSSYVCPCCNVPMVLRNGRSGKFYGCPNYPECKQTKNL